MTQMKSRSLFARRARRRAGASNRADPTLVFKTFVRVLAQMRADTRAASEAAALVRDKI